MSAFILYTGDLEKFFGPNTWYQAFFNDLISGKENYGYCLDYVEGSLIKEDDLIIVMEQGKFWPLLGAIGRATSDYEHVTDGEHEGNVIEIHFDFIIGEHKDFTQFSTLLKKSGVDLYELNKSEVQISSELAEKLIKQFAVVYMASPYPHSSFAFNPKRDKKQLLCNYLNEFCPEFRNEVIKRFPLEYKNYKEGEVIDRELIELTYDKSVRFPGLCLDWNLLFDIVRPRA